MGQNEIIQIEAVEDGCLYVYSFAAKLWTKVCRVVSFDDLPGSVKTKLWSAEQDRDARKRET